MQAKYNEFLLEAQSVKDSRYTFSALGTYADQLLAVYESELVVLKKYRDKYVNTSENLRAIKSLVSTVGLKPCDVAHTILLPTFPTTTDQRLLDVIDFSAKLAAKEQAIRMNMRELEVIIKRIHHLNDRNVL